MELAFLRERQRQEDARRGVTRFAEPPIYDEMDGWRQRYRARQNHSDPDQLSSTADEERRQANLRSRVDQYRDQYSEQVAATQEFEKAMAYLQIINKRSNSLLQASFLDNPWMRQTLMNNESTIIRIGESIPGPHPCTWLTAGSRFSGLQFSTRTHENGQIRTDKWGVRVAIQSVDWENKKLFGQMEADNSSDASSNRSSSGVITFMEGEIIDFDRFGLVTRGLNSNITTDALNWRKLKALNPKENPDLGRDLAQKLCTRPFLEHHLHDNYILMRWKGVDHQDSRAMEFQKSEADCCVTEKYFIPESATRAPVQNADEQSGLTISGFYYVCLTRQTGDIQAYYFDPEGSPHQQLAMKPLLKLFPAPPYR